MQVVLKQALQYNQTLSAAGDTVDVTDAFARELVGKGRATYVTNPKVYPEDWHLTKDQGDALFHAKADQVIIARGAAAPAAALGFGTIGTEGLNVKVIEETISFAGNSAMFKALTTPIPAGSVILSVQANIEAALTGGGTTVKVGIGPNASDPDKYGKTSALTKNAKISTIPAWTVLGSNEQLDVCANTTAGATGDTALTVGSVRVRIVYLQASDLKNA